MNPRVLIATLTIGLSAFLLFLIQPIFGRLLLPRVGGAAAVWNTALAFFQLALLAGYILAHRVVLHVTPAAQRVLFSASVLACLLMMPVALPATSAPPVESSPVIWILVTLAMSIGPPFVVLAANSTMIQSWFASAAKTPAESPYFLYAASNAGSLGALVAYPAVIERLVETPDQTRMWTGLYVILAVLVAMSAFILRPAAAALRTAPEKRLDAKTKVPWTTRMLWLFYAAVPSSLLIGITGHITLDIAPIPLFWVVPLAIYLITFILAFMDRPILGERMMTFVLPFGVIAGWIALELTLPLKLSVTLLLLFLFVVGLTAHQRLALSKPRLEYLGEFYVWLATGGALGGTLTSLLAPLVFDSVLEVRFGLAAAAVLAVARPSTHSFARRLLPPLVCQLALALLMPTFFKSDIGWLWFAGQAIIIFLVFQCRIHPISFLLSIFITLILLPTSQIKNDGAVFRLRSFYGVAQVVDDPKRQARTLMHGSTLHNLQAFDNARRHEPTTYYSRSGPVGQVFTHALATSPTANIGVVGLGTGAMSCLGNSDQNWTYFELDPHILKLARDSGLFTFLETCAPRARFVIGDGRRTLEQEPDGRFDIVAVDVFSSDSIPVHMLTREAIQTYGRVLKADGILLLHISNRYLNLAGPIAATLTSLGWRLRLQRHRPNEEDALLITPSEWIVAARGGDVFDRVVSDARWTTIEVLPGTRPWTDSFSNLISTLR